MGIWVGTGRWMGIWTGRGAGGMAGARGGAEKGGGRDKFTDPGAGYDTNEGVGPRGGNLIESNDGILAGRDGPRARETAGQTGGPEKELEKEGRNGEEDEG